MDGWVYSTARRVGRKAAVLHGVKDRRTKMKYGRFYFVAFVR